MTSSKNPMPLATNPFLSPSQKNCWPKLLHELSLEDGLESFLEWENQFLQFGRLVGSSEHPKQYVDCQLLNLLEESVGPVLKDLDFEAFAEEVFKIFDDDEETVIISNPISWANLNSILKISKPMVLSSVVEAPTVKVVNDRVVDEEEAMKNQAGRQFLEAEVEKQIKIDAEAVLESKTNAQNQVKNHTVANVQDKSLDPNFLEADLEGKTEAQTQAEATGSYVLGCQSHCQYSSQLQSQHRRSQRRGAGNL